MFTQRKVIVLLQCKQDQKENIMHDIRYFIAIFYYKTCHYTGIAIGISLQGVKIRFSITRYYFSFFNSYLIHYINKSASLQGIAIGSSLQGITIRLVITIRHYITRYYNKTALDILELWSDCAEATVDLIIPLVQQ